MKWKIMGRAELIKFSHKPTTNSDKIAVISINDIDLHPVRIYKGNPNIIFMLNLQFDDVYADEPNAMTTSDADTILEFYNKIRDKVDMVIVQCEAGVSRSAGICTALMTIEGDDDMVVFRDPKYAPNKHCYYTVLERYFGSLPTHDHKFVENVNAYRKQEGLDDE